jgi:general secretion pathway protein H
MNRNPKTANAGFTLAEMLVVLAIMGMVGLVVSQSAAFRRQPSAKALAATVAAEMRRVSLKAVTTATPRAISVSTDDRTIITGGTGADIEIPDNFLLELTTASELQDRAGEGRIVFLADGASTGGEIRILTPDERGYAVSVHWLTGAIETRALP